MRLAFRSVAPPAGSKLAKVSVGMKPEQVKEIMGDPTSQATYMTGKMWIPWYFGPTHQTEASQARRRANASASRPAPSRLRLAGSGTSTTPCTVVSPLELDGGTRLSGLLAMR